MLHRTSNILANICIKKHKRPIIILKERIFDMETLQKVALVFTIVGAINWGLVGLLEFDLVAALFGDMTVLTRLVYSLVGITGLINVGLLFMHSEK